MLRTLFQNIGTNLKFERVGNLTNTKKALLTNFGEPILIADKDSKSYRYIGVNSTCCYMPEFSFSQILKKLRNLYSISLAYTVDEKCNPTYFDGYEYAVFLDIIKYKNEPIGILPLDSYELKYLIFGILNKVEDPKEIDLFFNEIKKVSKSMADQNLLTFIKNQDKINTIKTFAKLILE